MLAAPAGPAGPSPLDELVAKLRRLATELKDLDSRLDAAQAAAFAALGSCPMLDTAANEAWWGKYRQTDAWRIENEWDCLAERHNELLTWIMETPAASIAEAAAKLEAAALHCAWSENGLWVLDVVLADLRTLREPLPSPAGIAPTKAPAAP